MNNAVQKVTYQGQKKNVQEIKRKMIERPNRMKSTRIRTIPAKYKD
jgi:hypothetical protein